MAKKPFFLKDNSKPVWTEAFLCGTLSLSLAIVENMGKFSCVISGRMFVWLGAPGPHLTHSLLLHILCFSSVIHDLNFLPNQVQKSIFCSLRSCIIVPCVHGALGSGSVDFFFFLYIFLALLQTKSANTLLLNHVFSVLCLFFKGTDNCCFGKTLTTLSLTPISPVIFMKGFAVFSVSKANSYPASQISPFPHCLGQSHFRQSSTTCGKHLALFSWVILMD